MSIKEVSLSSTIEVKIAWAETSYQEFKEHFLRDKVIRDGLKGLKDAILFSHREMGEIGIARICTECEGREGGSCCGAGLENRYDGWLLLINLLLNQKFPDTRHDGKSCFFLGETGCLLYARHVICVNYLCKKITTRIDPQKISRLREKEGRELERLFFLHEEVKRVLRTRFALKEDMDRVRDNGKRPERDIG